MAIQPTESHVALTGLSEALVIFVIGGAGVGKSTQCSRLARDNTAIGHFSVGDLLRMVPASPERELIDARMRCGQLVPTELILPALEAQLAAKMMRDGTRRFLIDGFPRNLDQAVRFEDKMGTSIATLHLTCSPEIRSQRVAQRAQSSGRIDDNPATLQLRDQGFELANAHIIDYYRSAGRLLEINCDRPLDDIYQDFRTTVENIFEFGAGSGSGPSGVR